MRDSSGHGAALSAISRRIVGLHKEYYGKGPNKARTYYVDDLVVVMLGGGYTKVEETLMREGKTKSVMDQRHEWQQVMINRFRTVVEEEIKREVIAFISGTHQDPDLNAELFVLAPRDGSEEGRNWDGDDSSSVSED